MKLKCFSLLLSLLVSTTSCLAKNGDVNTRKATFYYFNPLLSLTEVQLDLEDGKCVLHYFGCTPSKDSIGSYKWQGDTVYLDFGVTKQSYKLKKAKSVSYLEPSFSGKELFLQNANTSAETLSTIPAKVEWSIEGVKIGDKIDTLKSKFGLIYPLPSVAPGTGKGYWCHTGQRNNVLSFWVDERGRVGLVQGAYLEINSRCIATQSSKRDYLTGLFNKLPKSQSKDGTVQYASGKVGLSILSVDKHVEYQLQKLVK
jgi:hypothetical protein